MLRWSPLGFPVLAIKIIFLLTINTANALNTWLRSDRRSSGHGKKGIQSPNGFEELGHKSAHAVSNSKHFHSRGGFPDDFMKTSLKPITTLENRSGAWACAALAILALALFLVGTAVPAAAQAGGAIEGTVSDTNGATIPDATVTATNVSTGVSTSRTTPVLDTP